MEIVNLAHSKWLCVFISLLNWTIIFLINNFIMTSLAWLLSFFRLLSIILVQPIFYIVFLFSLRYTGCCVSKSCSTKNVINWCIEQRWGLTFALIWRNGEYYYFSFTSRNMKPQIYFLTLFEIKWKLCNNFLSAN